MYISQLLPRGQSSKTALLTSIIEPDGRNTDKYGEFIVKKVPLADRALIREYKQRANLQHQNICGVSLVQNSDFYLSVHLEKGKSFDQRDLIKIAFNKRAKLLADVLKGVAFLSQHYGYFYLTPKMLSYRTDGEISVWMHEDYFSNKPQYAINHGRFSEEIFVADFKETFGGNFQEMKQFRKAKNLSSLFKILNRGDDIYQSVLLSEPITKESLIYREETLKFSNFINSTHKENNDDEKRFHRGLKHAESLHDFVISVNSESYGQFQEKERKLIRTLSSPSSIRLAESINTNKLKSPDRSAYGSLTSQNLPRINFTYSNKQAWKKKQTNDSENDSYLLKSIKIKNNDQEQNSVRESSKEFLKASFPYTTTHSFSPLASFGSINLNSGSEQIVQDPQRFIDKQKQKVVDQGKFETGMQEIDEMEMQFENLFESNIMSTQQELQNLQVIMQQFECILEG